MHSAISPELRQLPSWPEITHIEHRDLRAAQPPRELHLEQRLVTPRLQRTLAAKPPRGLDPRLARSEERLKLLHAQRPPPRIAFKLIQMRNLVALVKKLARTPAELPLADHRPRVAPITHILTSNATCHRFCQHTLNWSMSRARQKFSIRHTEAVTQRVHEARRVLDLSINYYEQFKRYGDELASERCTERQLRVVLDELYPNGAGDSASSRTRRSRQQTKDRIAELFLRGETQGNAPRSKWAAVNAIIEYGELGASRRARELARLDA